MTKYSATRIGSWLSAAVLTCAIGATGCGDNLHVDLGPRDTDRPDVGGASDVEPTGPEFFIPDDNEVYNNASRFVPNANNPEDLVYVPGNGGPGWFYWVSSDLSGYAIVGADNDGSGAGIVITRSTDRPTNLTGDNVGLHWSTANRGSVYFHEFDGGVTSNTYNFPDTVTALATDGSYLYVGTANGDITIADRGAGGSEWLTSASGVPSTMTRIDDSVFWTTHDDGLGGALHEYDLEKDNTLTHLRGFSFEAGFAINDDSIFWADNHDRSIYAVDRTGGEPYVLASGQYQLTDMTISRFALYFATDSNDMINRVPLAGGPVTALNSELADVSGLILTEDNGQLFMITGDNIMYLEL